MKSCEKVKYAMAQIGTNKVEQHCENLDLFQLISLLILPFLIVHFGKAHLVAVKILDVSVSDAKSPKDVLKV